MASQITHIPYGKKVLEKYLSNQVQDEKKFFLGTLFPDIRYLGVIPREISHYSDPTIEGLQKIEGDFEKGRYAHALVDIEREKTLTKLGAYDLIESTPFVTYAMKFIEDEINYSRIQDWQKYEGFLADVLPEEEVYVPKDVTLKWHLLLRGYFSQPPTQESVIAFAKGLSVFKPEYIPPTLAEMAKIKGNLKLMEAIEKTFTSIFER